MKVKRSLAALIAALGVLGGAQIAASVPASAQAGECPYNWVTAVVHVDAVWPWEACVPPSVVSPRYGTAPIGAPHKLLRPLGERPFTGW